MDFKGTEFHMDASKKKEFVTDDLEIASEKTVVIKAQEDSDESSVNRMLSLWADFTNTFDASEKKIMRVSSLDTLKPKK